MSRGVLITVMILLLTSCVVKHLVGGPRLTGTCQGACSHYVECKVGAGNNERRRCETDEFFDGPAPRQADTSGTFAVRGTPSGVFTADEIDEDE